MFPFKAHASLTYISCIKIYPKEYRKQVISCIYPFHRFPVSTIFGKNISNIVKLIYKKIHSYTSDVIRKQQRKQETQMKYLKQNASAIGIRTKQRLFIYQYRNSPLSLELFKHRGVGSIFRLRGHQKCKPQIESRSLNLTTK